MHHDQRPAHLELTPQESAIITDKQFFYTKHQIVDKVYSLFGTLAKDYRRLMPASKVSEQVLAISPKIYKGENYGLLPYVMLDWPRYYNKQEVFAIRSLFWWGM